MTDEELKRAAGFQSDPKWAAELLGLPVIRGAKFVCTMPDGGPWDVTVFCGRQFWVSQVSGLYELVDDKLVKIEPMFEPKETEMRKIDDHFINPVNDQLEINVVDEPGSGGANHAYDVVYNPSGKDGWVSPIRFQNGPINEAGINGVTHEVLLAVLMDRLRAFQKGPFSCKENSCALTHIEEALHWLQQRTIARMRRGVEGTHQV